MRTTRYRIQTVSSLVVVVAATACLIAPENTATAEVITGVTIEDVSSELTSGTFDRQALYAINGNGFEPNGSGTHSAGLEGIHWLSEGTLGDGADPLPVVITFDLEGNYHLDSFTVWNYNETGLTSRGANNVEILLASSDVAPAFVSLGDFTFTVAPGSSDVRFGQVAYLGSFPVADDVRLVRFNITTNHAGGDNNFAGLSEVRFDGQLTIPEPSALVLAVLVLLGQTIGRYPRASVRV